jgi:hypothetical protein
MEEIVPLLRAIPGQSCRNRALRWSGSGFLQAAVGLPGIEPGAPADFVVYRRDPRPHPETLDHPELISLTAECSTRSTGLDNYSNRWVPVGLEGKDRV